MRPVRAVHILILRLSHARARHFAVTRSRLLSSTLQIEQLKLQLAKLRRRRRGGERTAAIYSLIGIAKLNDIDPQSYLR
jgi:hypothetical protein